MSFGNKTLPPIGSFWVELNSSTALLYAACPLQNKMFNVFYMSCEKIPIQILSLISTTGCSRLRRKSGMAFYIAVLFLTLLHRLSQDYPTNTRVNASGNLVLPGAL